MFLNKLDNSLKNLFLEFGYIIANADGNFSTPERELLKSYCTELQIDYNLDEKKSPSEEEIISKIKEISKEQERRIIIFELVGLAMTDGDYSELERNIIKNAQKEFGFSEDFEKLCEILIDRYLKIQIDMNSLVLED